MQSVRLPLRRGRKSQIWVVDMIFASVSVCVVWCRVLTWSNGGIYWVTSPSIVSEHSSSCDNNWALLSQYLTLNRGATIIICWLPRQCLLSLCSHSALTPHKFHRLILSISSVQCPAWATCCDFNGGGITSSRLWCWCEEPGAVAAHYPVSLHNHASQSEAGVERLWPIRGLITWHTGCCKMATIGRQLGPSYSHL